MSLIAARNDSANCTIKDSKASRTINYAVENARALACISVVIIHFGFFDPLGSDIHAILLYAVPFFYMVSGFYLYDSDPERQMQRLEKGIRKFGILYIKAAIICALLSIMDWRLKYGSYTGLIGYLSKTSVLELLVDNTWPFELGGPIWFLLALVYTLVILWFLCRFKMQFFCLPLALICLVVNSVFTEFYGLWGQGDVMFTGNFFTRGIPFVFLGFYFRQHENFVRRINNYVCIVLILLGIILPVIENHLLKRLNALTYEGYFQGNLLLAVGLLLFCLNNPNIGKYSLLFYIGHFYSLGVFLVHQPLGELINEWFVIRGHIDFFWGNFKPLTVFLLSMILVMIYRKLCALIWHPNRFAK